MNLAQLIWRSSLGRKYLMAGSGLLLFGFLIGHLLGNLQVFGSPDLINTYAYFLKSKPGLLWGARLGLLVVIGVHLASAISLTLQNRAARPVPYAAGGKAYGAPANSRTMVLSGSVILAFVIYHLLHFTALLPAINGVGDFRKLETTLPNGVRVHDVYAMMILGFQVWWVTLFYLIAQVLLFLHLSHGLSSMFQSLGLRNHTWWPRVRGFAQAASLALFVGYASIPIAVLAGLGGGYAEKARHGLQHAAVSGTAMESGKEVVR